MKYIRLYKPMIAVFLIIILCIEVMPAMEVQAASAEVILNSAPLAPMQTNYAPLDNLVNKVLKKVVKEDMSTYEKVKACYDYLIYNMSYSNNIYNASAYNEIMNRSYASPWDKKIIYYAYSALKNKKDSCYGYSSAFVALTRAIGLESYVMQGETALAKGGYGNHWWVNIKIDGKYYVFDPNVEDDIAKGKTIYYYRFCKLDSELPNKYIYKDREADITQFNQFLEGISLKSIKISQSKATLFTGENKTLTVIYKPDNAIVSDKTKWKSSNKKIATVSKNGTITAKKAGTVYITATVGQKTTKCKVTVKQSFIKLKQSSVTLKKVGKQYLLKAKFSSDLKDKTMKWKSSNQEVVTVSENGELQAAQKGTATITASIGKIKAKCKVTVK